MFLKTIDPLSYLVPGAIRKIVGLPPRPGLGCIIRPGGLGDLVVLTRACLELGIDIWRVVWIVEKRNNIWCQLLKLPFISYDDIWGVNLALKSRNGFDWVIDTEQTFGLSAVFACRLTDAKRPIIGFETSRAAHLHDINISHSLGQDREIDSFKHLLEEAAKTVEFPKLTTNKLEYVLHDEIRQQRHVVLAVGGRRDKKRCLSIDDWVSLAKKAKELSDDVFVVGAVDDTKFAVELMVQAPFLSFNFVGRIPFEETVSLIRASRRLFSVDGGLVHVADFFDRPSTVIFANEEKRIRWSPIHQQSCALLLDNFRKSQQK